MVFRKKMKIRRLSSAEKESVRDAVNYSMSVQRAFSDGHSDVLCIFLIP